MYYAINISQFRQLNRIWVPVSNTNTLMIYFFEDLDCRPIGKVPNICLLIFSSKCLFFLQAGMVREIFQTLVSKLEEHCDKVLVGSEIDYRRFIAQRSVNRVRINLPFSSHLS